jgi:hypothetical protein
MEEQTEKERKNTRVFILSGITRGNDLSLLLFH